MQTERSRVARGEDGVGVAYRVHGEGRLNVILVHGWICSGTVWDYLLEDWDLRGLRVFVPSLRGTGGSAKPEGGYSLEAFARDVLAVADAEGLKSFVLVGHSMGGQVCQVVAARAPERVSGLVLLCTVPATGATLPDEETARLFRESGGDREAQGKIHNMAGLQLTYEAHERMLDDGVTIPRECVAEGFDAWTGGFGPDRSADIMTPTLVLATDDPFFPAGLLREQVVEKVPGSRLAYLPGPGHYPHVEAPAQTAALLQSFLAGIR